MSSRPTYRINPYAGPLAAWPAAHATFLLPSDLDPWNELPPYLVGLIMDKFSVSGMTPDAVSDLIQTIRPPSEGGVYKRRTKLHDLDVWQGIALLDVLMTKAGGTREPVADADQSQTTGTLPLTIQRPDAA